jgi:hypothetical protein
MPYHIKKVGAHFQVHGPSGVHAKHTTKDKAEAQVRLLNAVDRGWKPGGGKQKHQRSLKDMMK